VLAPRHPASVLVALALATAAVAGATSSAAAPPKPRLLDWPEFGLTPQRTNATGASTGITAQNVRRLRARVVTVPGTADNSAVYEHGARVGAGTHDVAVVTTSYGITVAIDADSGRTLWTFRPPGLRSWLGSAQITTASPLIRAGYVYATSPNGLVHKLSLADGREARGWPARITPAPRTEKLTASLNIARGELLASTGGYIGDAPPYVGHVVAISLADRRVEHVFNTLCANRARIIEPSTCNASDSAILSRSGPVVEPGGHRVLIATGNAPYNGTTDFGDSVIELTLPALRFRQAYTPTDQAQLNADDTDLGSGSPALLPGGLVLMAGKDGILRVLRLDALDGRRPPAAARTGGEIQTLPTPGGGQQLFSTPAVWHHMVFVADGGGTTGYRISGGRLEAVWQNGNHGTSPILAGGLLYVYNMDSGGIFVYRPASGHAITELTAPAGHWNSPIVVDGHVIEPVGNDNDHQTTGQVEILSSAR
jgi:outer membrane protein assembly factor BamB